ncbi:MAG TPA: hypothetical protein VNF72_06895, partial [Myxococcota bacterium]|nr:hypothetical protein [Myxococcota bacterium]
AARALGLLGVGVAADQRDRHVVLAAARVGEIHEARAHGLDVALLGGDGGEDNVTVALVRCDPDPEKP